MSPSPPFRRTARRSLVIACTALWITAFVLTHIPAERITPPGLSDKTLHFLGYFMLSGLFMLALAGLGTSPLKRSLTGICVMTAYAAFDELTQGLVGRHTSFGDAIADVLGAAAGVVLIETILKLTSIHRARKAQGREVGIIPNRRTVRRQGCS